MIFGEAHLRHILSTYVRYHNELRPHQSLGNRPLSGTDPPPDTDICTTPEVECEELLGGLLKHYYRAAA